jgi:hypothetical protein
VVGCRDGSNREELGIEWARLFLQPFLEPQLFGRRRWCGLQGQERRAVERIGRKTSGSTIGNQERAVYIGDLPLKPMDSTRRRKLGTGGDLSLWSFRDFHEIGFVSAGKFPIEGLAFSPDDSVLAAGSHDGIVFLYAVDKLHGPERTKQSYALCGEVSAEKDKVFIVPISKVPTPMSRDFSYGWKLEVVEPGNLGELARLPVAFQDWEIESNAAMDKARVNNFTSISLKPAAPEPHAEYTVFGDVQNPGWDRGFVVKVYRNGDFIAASNSGECLAYGSLDRTTTPSFGALKTRLLGEGFLSVPRDPLTRGLDHYRTRFIELFDESGSQVRSDAEVVDFSKPRTHPTKKEEDFTRIFNQEEPFINLLLHAGMHSVR